MVTAERHVHCRDLLKLARLGENDLQRMKSSSRGSTVRCGFSKAESKQRVQIGIRKKTQWLQLSLSATRCGSGQTVDVSTERMHLLVYGAHCQDRGLRRVHDGRKLLHAEHAQVGDGEGAAHELGGLQLALLCLHRSSRGKALEGSTGAAEIPMQRHAEAQ